MSPIQAYAERLIKPAMAISQEIFKYQRDCKSSGTKFDKSIIDSQMERIFTIIPSLRNDTKQLYFPEGSVKTQSLQGFITKSAYISASDKYENSSSDYDEESNLEIPTLILGIDDISEDDLLKHYEFVNVKHYDADGEIIEDDVDKPFVAIPKIQTIDYQELSNQIKFLVSSQIANATQDIRQSIAEKPNTAEQQPATQQIDVRYETAKMLNEMFNNNGVLTVASQDPTKHSISLNLNSSLKLANAKEHYTSLCKELNVALLKTNGIVKEIAYQEEKVMIAGGEIQTKQVEKAVFKPSMMSPEFIRVLMTSDITRDKNGKLVNLFDKWLETSGQDFNNRIDKWMSDNDAHNLSYENNEKFYSFFAKSIDTANTVISDTYFSDLDKSVISIKMPENPYQTQQSNTQDNTANLNRYYANELAQQNNNQNTVENNNQLQQGTNQSLPNNPYDFSTPTKNSSQPNQVDDIEGLKELLG